MADATPSAGVVRIELLGAPRLVVAGAPAHALERKDAALLALLALDGKGARARIATLLWPDAGADQGRNNLRQRLFRLRRIAGRDLVTVSDTLVLAQGVEHDLVEAAEPHVPATRAELLGTLNYADCAELDDWVASARARWRQQYRAALERHADQLERAGKIASALLCAERLVTDDPVAEDAARRLMRLHAARGDRAAALAAYQRLTETLARELAAQPADSTRALAARVATGAAAEGDPQRVQPPAILRPPRLIGRDAEWSWLEQAWNAARPVVALGEPGIGKSRLLADFGASREAAFRSGARNGDAAIAYALLARIVRGLVAQYDAPPAPWVRAELARLVPEIGVAAGGALDAVRLIQALGRLVDHVRNGGLAGLILDDLHYSDDASLEGLVALLGQETGRGLRLLLASRAGEEPRVLRDWRLTGAAVEIRLAALGREDVVALLASLALPGFDVAVWIEPLFRHTGGNPLFVLETMRVVLAGAATRDTSLPAPAHVGELIAGRLAQLTDGARDLAQVAALAGQDFTADLAAAVLRKHVLDIADAWRELEAAQVLREGAFAHDLILEATMRAVPACLAPALHRSIGVYLEAQGAPAARVAEHWFQAGEWGNAGRQFDAAARAQFNLSRNIEAGDLYRRAAACFETAGDQAGQHAALQELAGCQVKAFDLSDAREVAQQLQRIAANDEQRGWALDRLVDVLNLSREDDHAAHAAALDMRRLGHATGKPWMLFNATRKLAVALAQLGRHEEALALFETQQEWVQANLHEWNVHVWSCDHGFVLDLADRRAVAVAEYLRAEVLARERENWAVAYAALRNLAFTHAWAGRLDTAVRTSDQAAGFSSRLGEALVERNPRDAARRGALLRDAGRLSESLALLRGAHANLARGGSPYWLAYCEDQLALLYALLGQPARARDLLVRDVGALPPEARLSRWLVRARTARAEGREPARWSDAESAGADDPACPPRWRLLALLERARALDIEQALVVCNDVVQQARQRELGGIELAALALAAGRATAAQSMDVAAELAQQAHALGETTWPTGLSLPEVCLNIHRALVAGGDAVAAARAVERAVRWIEEQAQPNVPADFKDSFLSRNPVHRAVLTGVGRRPRR